MAEFTLRELDRQISEYEDGPMTRQTARDLSALYIIRDFLFPVSNGFSMEGDQFSNSSIIPKYGDSLFLCTIAGKSSDKVWAIIDELMDALQVSNPRVYNSVIKKINQ